jgi:hypothetical protein
MRANDKNTTSTISASLLERVLYSAPAHCLVCIAQPSGDKAYVSRDRINFNLLNGRRNSRIPQQYPDLVQQRDRKVIHLQSMRSHQV